jgi:hypothetical protein
MTDTNILDSPITSHCKTCSEDKPVSDFYLNNGRPRPYCKKCHSAACAERNRAKRSNKKPNGWQLQAKARARPLARQDRLESKRRPLPPIRPSRMADVTPRLVPLVELKFDECHYPYDAPAGSAMSFLFCGLKKMAGKPYCQAHCEIAYRPRDVLTPIRLPLRGR